MLYALGFIGLFTIGGLTGLFLATTRRGSFTYTTRTSSSHISTTSWSAAWSWRISAASITGGRKSPARMYPEGWARLAALIVFIGFNLTFFPQFVLGYLGMPRRYHAYPEEFQVLNVMSTAGASILAVGYRAADGLSDLVAAIWPGRSARTRGARPGWSGRHRRRRRQTISRRRRS